MANKPRKRFNAFDDFPGGDERAQPAQTTLPATQPVEAEQAAMERIERLKPSQMLPDRFQPRRLLPATLREAFFSGQMDCYQAASGWLALARSEEGYRIEVERLLAMGSSFQEHGQIKPITGTWVPASDGRFIFLIETGERRFWAACLQTAVLRDAGKSAAEPLLRVEVIQSPSRQRQVLENRHAEAPSAVSQACEVAALILAETGVQPPSVVTDEYGYFRQARAQRMPVGLWDKLMPIMQLSRVRMVQLLNILQLPTPLLEVADRYRLPERVLREVVGSPRDQWERMLRSAVQANLTADEVAELAGRPSKEPRGSQSAMHPDPARAAASSLRRFGALMDELDEFSQARALDEIANSLVATRQAEGIMNLLSELSKLVYARLARM